MRCNRSRLLSNFTDISQGSVAKHFRRGGTFSDLLQMFSWFRQWNKFAHRSIFDEVKSYEIKA